MQTVWLFLQVFGRTYLSRRSTTASEIRSALLSGRISQQMFLMPLQFQKRTLTINNYKVGFISLGYMSNLVFLFDFLLIFFIMNVFFFLLVLLSYISNRGSNLTKTIGEINSQRNPQAYLYIRSKNSFFYNIRPSNVLRNSIHNVTKF